MRVIVVLNTKGGTGKSTIACNLAAYCAVAGPKVGLIDYDQQRSAIDWLGRRPADRPKIDGYEGEIGKPFDVESGTDFLVVDSPAAAHGDMMKFLLSKAHTAIIPIVPSAFDINAASRFIVELMDIGRVLDNKVRVATVANRAREYTLDSQALDDYLQGVTLPNRKKIPFVATLRQSVNYSHGAEKGLSIFEMAPSKVSKDVESWQPLIDWLSSRQSLPIVDK